MWQPAVEEERCGSVQVREGWILGEHEHEGVVGAHWHKLRGWRLDEAVR